jgi:sortase B
MAVFPIKGDGAFEAGRKVVFLAAVIAFIYFGGDVLLDITNEAAQQISMNNFVNNVIGNVDIDDEVKEQAKQDVPGILDEYIAAYNLNNDFVGFIRIGDTALPDSDPNKYFIRQPVYQTVDNEFYLNHAHDRTNNEGGAIFADYRGRIEYDHLSSNTILYGHNFYAGGYFTDLSKYYGTSPNDAAQRDKALAFYQSHPVVEFNTIYEKAQWKIFAVCFFNTQEKDGEVFDYNNKINFTSADDFNDFILNVMDRSVLFTDVDLTYGDYLLTMSTCYYPFSGVDTRVVVFARRVREGESADVDVSKAVYNHKEYRFERQAYLLGTEWNGRIWDTSKLLSYQG